jgi:SPOR domain
MRNNETGEFELVVGNRQLLSGFFIIVLLFAVAFAMGYVVGQNSPRSSKLETAATATPVPVPAPVQDTGRPAAAPAAATDTAPPAANPGDSAPPPDAANAAPPAASGAGSAAAAPPSDTAAESGGASALPAGSYWQAIAVPQADAEVIGSSLKEKGLPIVLTPGTRNLTRVLVGPYPDKQSLGKAKTDLENAGFHPFLWKP